MNEITDGGPAFPGTVYTSNEKPASFGSRSHSGMTLRDYFAAKAMQALIHVAATAGSRAAFSSAADAAYEVADAMLVARERA